jgi:hypothetical protein
MDRGAGPLRVTQHFRPDGWPLCPRCGEDELYCLEQCYDLSHDHRTPPCPGMRCYRCNWHGADPRTPAAAHPLAAYVDQRWPDISPRAREQLLHALDACAGPFDVLSHVASDVER